MCVCGTKWAKVTSDDGRVRRVEDRLFSADVGRHIAMTVVSGGCRSSSSHRDDGRVRRGEDRLFSAEC